MSKRTLAVLIVVAACVLAGTAVAAADDGDPDVPTVNDTDSADEAYVSDDGTVILASDDESAADGAGEFGVNVTDGLVFGQYSQPVETNVTGAFSMDANQSGANATGSLAMPKPDELESLDVSLDSETTAENSRSDLDLATTVALPEDSGQLTAMFEEFTSNGSATTTGSTFETQGAAEWSATTGVEPQEHAFDLRATEDGHVLEAAQSYNVSSFGVDQWDTREKAVQSLDGQFSMAAQMVNGSSNFTMDSYSFESTDAGGHLDVEYTVEFQGIHDFLRQGIADSLSESTQFGDGEDLDLQLDDVSIERVAADADVNRGSGSANWDVAVEGYDQLLLAYMEAMERADDSGMIENQTDQLDAQYEAMQAAEYAQTGTWDLTASTTSGGSIQADASVQQRTDNWEAYVSEREARDLPSVGTQTVTFDAATEGEEVVMDGSFLLHQEEMYDQTLETLGQSFEQSSSMTSTPEVNPFARIAAADFLGSRLDASVNESVVSADGHASFGNLSAITTMMDEELAAGSVDQAYVDVNGDTPTAYVRIENMVESDDVDESALREHEMISEETSIYLPGEWDTDSRTVNAGDGAGDTTMLVPMATDDTQESDGTETDEDTQTTEEPSGDDTVTTAESGGEETDTTTTNGPGFGAVLGIVAVLAVAMLGTRRH